MKRPLLLLLFALMLIRPTALSATMTGGQYEIYADSWSYADSVSTDGNSYDVFDSGTDGFATSTTGGTYTVHGGFQAMTEGLLTFTLSKTAVSLGTLSQAAVSSDSLTATVSTDNNRGYTLAASEDGNLRSGSNDVNDVSDGSVSAGSEEYGISSSGSHALLSSDTAVSGSVLVASAAGSVKNSATTIVFRASAGPNTIGGSYSHTVTFTVTVNP